MKVYAIYILNKAGGLIYQKDTNPGLNKLSANDYLILAGTLHGVHAIASKLTPTTSKDIEVDTSPTNANYNLLSTGKVQNPNTNASGLQSVETDLFNLYIFQTLSGIKFVVVTSPNTIVHNLQPITEKNLSRGVLNEQLMLASDIFKQLYILYSDYVMKDPFYSLDMPIKSSLFDMKINQLAI